MIGIGINSYYLLTFITKNPTDVLFKFILNCRYYFSFPASRGKNQLQIYLRVGIWHSQYYITSDCAPTERKFIR